MENIFQSTDNHPPAPENTDEDPRRVSCHRCGNIRRKRNTLCSRCPHTFCFRCTAKMKEDYGISIFVGGCPVCKEVCCCGKNKSTSCQRKHHCYRKCPTSKKSRGVSSRRPGRGTDQDRPTYSSPGLYGPQSLSESHSCITPRVSARTSLGEDDWSETDARQGHRAYSSAPAATAPAADACFQTIPRDCEHFGPALLLDDPAQLSFNDSDRNPLGTQRFNQLPGIDSIQRARSKVIHSNPGSPSAHTSGVTTIPSSGEGIHFDEGFAEFGALFDPMDTFGDRSPQFLSDPKFDFELNFLDDLGPDQEVHEVARLSALRASSSRVSLAPLPVGGSRGGGETARAHPRAEAEPCAACDQENISASAANQNKLAAGIDCGIHIVEI